MTEGTMKTPLIVESHVEPPPATNRFKRKDDDEAASAVIQILDGEDGGVLRNPL